VPVLDARALDTDPEGLALLRAVLDDTAGQGEGIPRPRRLPMKDAFNPAARPVAAPAADRPEPGAPSAPRQALAFGA
jgi:hypothetical protein